MLSPMRCVAHATRSRGAKLLVNSIRQSAVGENWSGRPDGPRLNIIATSNISRVLNSASGIGDGPGPTEGKLRVHVQASRNDFRGNASRHPMTSSVI